MLRFFLAALLLMPISFWGNSILDPLKQTVHDDIIPSPFNLSSNWWQYYDVDREKLEKRKADTEKLFSDISNNLPEEDKAKVKALSEKFISGLQTLIDLKGQSLPVASYVASFPEKYTFQQWLSLGGKLLENEHDLEEKQLKFNLMQLSIRSGNRQLDTFFAAYLVDKKEEKSVRLFKSLEIMNMKVNLAVEQIKLSMIKAEVDVQKEKIKQIEKEVLYSQSHINYKSASVSEIDAKISQVEARIKASEGELTDFYDLKVDSSTAGDSTLKREVAEQQLIEQSLNRILDQMLLINFKIQKLIVQWGKKEVKVESSAGNDFKEQVDQIAKEVGEWKNKSELMLEQALKNPTLLTRSEEDPREKALFQQLLKNTESIILKIQQIQNEIFFSKFLSQQVHVLKKQLPTTVGGVFLVMWNGTIDFFSTHATWFKQSLFKVGNVPVTPLGILKVIFIILIAFLVGKFFKGSIRRFGKKHELMTSSSLYILSRLVYYIILVIGFIIAGASIGFDLTAFAFIAGAITVWIGFSLQSIFHNFISGIIILLTKTLNVGDTIVLDTGETGQIVEINLRTTILATADGVDIVIPNSDLVTKKFTNRTLVKNSRRVNVPFRIPLGVDKAFIKKILVEVVKTVPITLPQPEPEIWFMSYGDCYLNCELAVWVNEFLSPLPNMSTNAFYFNLIDDTLRAHNIEIPIIHGLTVHMKNNADNQQLKPD